jgi:hypothetical protein
MSPVRAEAERPDEALFAAVSLIVGCGSVTIIVSEEASDAA